MDPRRWLAAPAPWPGTVVYLPLLYLVGWLASRPLAWLMPGWRSDQVDLAGLALALVLLLLTLPLRLRRHWQASHPWQSLGVVAPLKACLKALIRGLLKALLLLGPLVLLLLLGGQARWLGELGGAQLLNALALLLGVGFAEELLFRGWLWGELEQLLSPQQALGLQAAIFALVHPWYRLPPSEAIALLGGLVLLGLVLALQRRADGGVLWGSVGLHGGLVGGWFALQNGLLQLSPATPTWLIGPGGASPNPIGGALGWLGLLSLLWIRRRYLQSTLEQQIAQQSPKRSRVS